MHPDIIYRNDLKLRAQKLRNSMTRAEKILWYRLRKKLLSDVLFTRQKPLGPYIIDFYAAKFKLAIEVDGPSHWSKEAIHYDNDRDFYLKSLGVRVLRFTNEEIHKNIENVLQQIIKQFEILPLS